MKPLLALIVAFFAISEAYAQMPPPPHMRMISVSGEAKEELSPDQATLNASLISRAPVLNEAKKHNDGLMEKLVGIAKEFKIAREKINASNVYISPEYRYEDNSGKQIFTGYVVNRSVAITMDDMSIHERVLSALIDAKIDQVGGVQFTLKNPEEVEMKLRTKAIANARAKAESMAQAAGAKLGQVIAISESGAAMPHPPMPMHSMAMMDTAEKASVAPSLPGQLTMSQSVNVTFGLE